MGAWPLGKQLIFDNGGARRDATTIPCKGACTSLSAASHTVRSGRKARPKPRHKSSAGSFSLKRARSSRIQFPCQQGPCLRGRLLVKLVAPRSLVLLVLGKSNERFFKAESSSYGRYLLLVQASLGAGGPREWSLISRRGQQRRDPGRGASDSDS